MKRLQPLPWIAFLSLAVLTLSVWTRPTLQAQQPASVIAPALVGGAFGGGNPKSEWEPPIGYVQARRMSLEATRVWLKLQEKIPMQFPKQTSLEDLVKYIQESTADKENMPNGIPIYVDPIGLQDADKTMADTITINLKGIPLATTLKLALTQLSLVYRINPEGLLTITASANEEPSEDFETRLLNEIAALRRQMGVYQWELRRSQGMPLNADVPNPVPPTNGQPGTGGGFR
jgi:hypothetical protein